MIEIQLGQEDLGRIRFARSPVHETICSLSILADATRRNVHRHWCATAETAIRRLRLRLLPCLLRDSQWTPDFLLPVPKSRTEPFEQGLEQISGTAHETVRTELAAAFVHRIPAALTDLYTDPGHGLAMLTRELARYHEAAIAPIWPRLAAALDIELNMRAAQFVDGGLADLLHRLHPRLRYDRDRLKIEASEDVEVPALGRGVLLMPSVFLRPRLMVRATPDSVPVLWYPALTAPEPEEREADLGELVGRSRSLMLTELGVPTTTTRLAATLGISAPAANAHLAILCRAGLAIRYRSGREVYYQRTGIAELLLGTAKKAETGPVKHRAGLGHEIRLG